MEVSIIVESIEGIFIATARDDMGEVATSRGRNKHAAIERCKTRAIARLEDAHLVFNVADIGE